MAAAKRQAFCHHVCFNVNTEPSESEICQFHLRRRLQQNIFTLHISVGNSSTVQVPDCRQQLPIKINFLTN